MPSSSCSNSPEAFLFQSTCLKPTYSLRRQVLFSFGITGVVTTCLVIGMACICAISAGNLVRDEARNFMRQEVMDSISNSSQYAAETFGQELDHLRGTVSLIVEIVRDRIANYPLEGWAEDQRVPFVGMDGTRRYPLKTPLLPRDWNLTLNVNPSNHREHLQELFDLLLKQHGNLLQHPHGFSEFFPGLSTASAVYSFQGNCDPSATDPTDPKYYPGCTPQHNNGTTGGVLAPTNTSAGLEQKAADIGLLLKPIWESRPDLLQVTVQFVNEGAGSIVHFPSFVHPNTPTYESLGCDWLYENTNPYTNKPFLSKELVQKNCHRKGTMVPRREINPLEQEWCKDQALNPNSTRFFGPVGTRNVLFASRQNNNQTHHPHDSFFWIMRVGRAVFDRYTGELIGCVGIGVLLNRWTELIEATTLAAQSNHSNALLIRKDDGIVVAGGGWDLNTQDLQHILDTGAIVHNHSYRLLLDELQRKQQEQDEEEKKMEKRRNASATAIVGQCDTDGRVLAASAIPGSNFVYVQSVGEEVFDVVNDIQRSIDQDVIYATGMALVIGGVGMTILMIIVYTVSMVLTRPLKWIQGVAYRIVNHTTASLERKSLKLESYEENESDVESAYGGFGNSLGYLADPILCKCTPDTEITELVREFKRMIRGFSGAGKASTVAKSTVHEIRNTLAWQSDFQHLYNKAKAGAKVLPKSGSALNHSLQGLDRESDLCPHAEENSSEMNSSVRSSCDRSSREEDVAGMGSETTTGSCDDNATAPRGNGASAPASNNENDNNEPIAYSADPPFRSAKRQHLDSPLAFSAEKPTAPEPAQPDFVATISATTATTTTFMQPSMSNEPWKNGGRNLNPPVPKEECEEDGRRTSTLQSPLFRWILIFIVIPMIVTNVVIVTTVSVRIISVLPRWLEHIEEVSFDRQLADLRVASRLASVYAAAVLATPVRDLFVYTRLAAWLFTNAVERDPGAFPQLGTGAETCKHYAQNCPWYDDPFANAPCDCSWEVRKGGPKCFQIEDDTRHMQKLFYAGQRNDAHPVTGMRSNTSYPILDNTAANTAWWNDQASVPGAFKGNNASGYETTYDRLKVFSALSVMIFPLYNYRPTLVSPMDHQFLGAYFGFESDGMLAGWAGCKYPSPTYPHFQSKESNGAYITNSTLCPKGAFGYDSRCRSWYDTGKEMALSAVNTTSIFITPPYEFASRSLVASSITQGVTDPQTGEHIGQTLIDFQQIEMLNFGLIRGNDSFHFVISPSGDNRTGDTVVPPGPTYKNDFRKPIGDLVLPFDAPNSTNRLQFEEIVKDMKEGNSSLQSFTRTWVKNLTEGDDTVLWFHEETIWLAYDPVHIRALDAVQPDDYSRGLNVSYPLVYSLGVGRNLESLQQPFNEFEDAALQQLRRNVGIYVAMTILISLIATAVACRISVAVTRPMIILLTVVRNINSGKIDDDIPPLFGGSREVNQVYTSFAKLYKIVRVSNSAFFMRNLHWACHFVRDALKLFTKIDDRKAIAIASSNLGSTLLAINCGRPRESRCNCLKVDAVCCVKEAFLHFDTAVHHGTQDFENAPTMSTKVAFAEQLADRHFNRALYFLLSQDDPCAEDNFHELGLQDLMKAQALDLDVQEYWIQNGVLMQKANILFERLLRRLHGVCALMENNVPQHIWNPKVVAYDCHRVLSAAWEDQSATLFDEFSPIGRLQQLEGALIHFQLQRDQEADAARIAMRMLVEDEFINEAAFQYAADAVLQYTRNGSTSDPSWSVLSKALVERDIQNMLKSCKQTTVNTRKCIFYCLELSDDSHLKNDDLRSQLLALYDAQCGKEDFFGLVASHANNPLTGDNNLIQLGMESKQQKQGEQRSGIESAIDALGVAQLNPLTSRDFRSSKTHITFKLPKTCKVLSAALDKVIESEVSAVYDSYVLYVTDGPKRSWDWKVLSLLKSRIEEMNAKRRGDIHLIIFDLEESSDDSGSGSTGKEGLSAACANLCRVSKGSIYIKASLGSLEEDFGDVRACLTVGNKSSTACSSALMSGITMEKF